mmetsp:Transcript_31857/g.77213  ORF Transcript_31857/g.77213 Transcript_31857/m.77213 type:complete len:288 (-) Transcript_31857:209-1072(-)
MFFCNPFQQPTGRKEDDDGDNNRFRCLIDDINFSWRPSFDFGASINSSNNMNLRSRTASFSTGSVSTFDGAEDNNFVSNERFRDASSSDSNRQRISPLNTTIKGKKTRSTTQFQRSKLTRSSSKLMILLLCSCVILLGIRILGWHYDRMTTNDILESSSSMIIIIKDTIISSAVRIWNGVIPSTSKLIEILGKIPWAISSLFRWDEVDDAIIEWTKKTIILVPQKISEVVTSTTAIHDPATTLLPSMQTLMEHVSRLILGTIENFTGPAPGAQQALALLDFLQDVDL